MANTNIQGAVPLTGTGFVAKRNGNYERGEFKRLVNAEIDDEVIRNRRSIVATGNSAFSVADPFPIIGYNDDYVIVASATQQHAISINGHTALWAPTSLPVPTNGYHKLVGAFRYNKRNYWITLEYNPTGPVYNICLYHTTTDLLTATFANLTRTVIVTGNSFPIINNFFIHKERLFVGTSTAVYFSKATDPSVFAVPNGGFISMSDAEINYCFALNDTVYILSDNAVHVFSYSVDPNGDGYLRAISNSIGGEWGCSHQSTPFLINKSGIYSITNLGVEKVHDTEFDVGDNVFESKILSFEDYLIVIRRSRINYAGVAESSALYWNNLGKRFVPNQNGNILNYNVFFINIQNGSTHVVDFTDSNDTTEKGYVIDAVVNPNRNLAGNYQLFFLTNKFVVGTSYKGSTYYMNPDREVSIRDTSRNSNDLVVGYKPRIDIEIDSFVPDGNEYMFKKFRNLLVMAKFPSSDFGLQVAYSNNPYGASITLTNPTVLRPHYPARVGLNQRGKSINIRFLTLNNYTPLVGNYDYLELSDVRLLWTYTGRIPEFKTVTV